MEAEGEHLFGSCVEHLKKKSQKCYILIYTFVCKCMSSHLKFPLKARALFYSSFFVSQLNSTLKILGVQYMLSE